MDVAFAADESYAVPLAVAVRSLVESTEGRGRLRVHVLDGGIEPGTKRRLADRFKATGLRYRFERVEADMLDELPGTRLLSRSMYLRLVAPMLLDADEAPRLLYLDCDTLVLDDVAPLFRESLDGAPLAAVRDQFIPCISAPGSGVPPSREGLVPDSPYFNSGALLFDVAAWQRHALGEQCLEYVRHPAAPLRNPDQDALNAVVGSAWHELERSWNFMVGQAGATVYFGGWEGRAADRAHRAARILHFVGPVKPWMDAFRDAECRRLYRAVGEAA
jgi:lipopolysaccharide biosynthesis glycosyltransferase